MLKANPEEFIHIFVTKSKELTEFLERMIKVSDSKIIEIIIIIIALILNHGFINTGFVSSTQVWQCDIQHFVGVIFTRCGPSDGYYGIPKEKSVFN